jgi:hypothetical protein
VRARESTASIDDLLGHGEEPEDPRSRRTQMSAGWLLGAALAAAALTAVTVFGMRLVGVGVSAVAVFGGFLALLLIRRVTAPLQPPPARRTALRRITGAQTLDRGHQDSLRIALRDWEERLTWADATRGGFARIVVPPLRELADERLRQRHGITRASEPDRARALLGDRLWTLLEGHADRSPTAGEYAAMASHLEKL